MGGATAEGGDGGATTTTGEREEGAGAEREASKGEAGEGGEVEGGGGVSEGEGREGEDEEGGDGGESDEGREGEEGQPMSTSCEGGGGVWGTTVECCFGRGEGEATSGVMGVRVRME